MPNMSLQKNKMPVQDPEIRKNNFSEVALGYTEEQAIDEAKRCLNCKNRPCVGGCPVNIKIPDFIAKVANGEFLEAYKIITEDSSLPAVCGRVCPQETQCESKCIRGIKGEPVGIGRLERFVADYYRTHKTEDKTEIKKNGHKVAIIGSGPSGLACAGSLISKGYDVTVFEALHVAGGVLSYGIPEFRLPKSIVKSEVNELIKKGVKFEYNTVIGKTLTIDELKNEYHYDAIFIGSGAGLPRFMNIKGENLNGVYSANEFLTRVNLMSAFKPESATPIMHAENVVVFGGGNVAMDGARVARRLGANVTVLYRRTEKELPARKEEVEHAVEEGIVFKFLTNPIEIRSDENGWVNGVYCQQMKLGEPDASGRARPIPIEGGEFFVPCDCVIVAIGTSPNPLIKSTTEGLDTNNHGCIIADENGATSLENVYAGGDAVTGAATVILAMGAGKTAAEEIDKKLMG